MIEKEILARVQGMSKPSQNDTDIMDVFHKETVGSNILKKLGVNKEEKKNEI